MAGLWRRGEREISRDDSINLSLNEALPVFLESEEAAWRRGNIDALQKGLRNNTNVEDLGTAILK